MRRPAPALLIVLVLIAAAKLTAPGLARAVLIGALFAIACFTAGHLLSRRRWPQWRRDVAARLGADRLRNWAASQPRAARDELTPSPPTRAAILRDLVVVFAIALGIRGVWAVVVPPWQAPDEPTHYLYTAHIIDQDEIPHPPNADDIYTTEVATSWNLTLAGKLSAAGGAPTYELPYLPIQYDYPAARAYQGSEQDRHSAGPLTAYPPLYYLYSALPYAVAKGGSVLSRLFAMRYGSVLLGALSCLFGYLMAFELRRERRWGLAVGLGMALMPMYVFITSVANNDAALGLLATALIWLIVRTAQRAELARGYTLAIGVTSGLALLTKPASILLVLVAGVVILVKALPMLRSSWEALRSTVLTLGLSAASATLVYGPWIFVRYHYYRDVRLLSIPFAPLFHLVSGSTTVSASTPPASGGAPHLVIAPLLATAKLSPWSYLILQKDRGWEYYHWLFVRTFWGDFGWLDAPFADRMYRPIVAFCAISVIGLIVQVFLQPARRTRLLLLVALLVTQILFLFIGVDYYQGFVQTGKEFGLQGRYLFPILAPLLFVLLSGWDHLWREHPLGLRIAVAGMAALQVVGLATVLTRYYGIVIG